MMETREVKLSLRLPLDIAAQAEEVQKTDPEFLDRVVMYGLTRRSIYRHLKESGEAEDDLEPPADGVESIPEEEGLAILAESRRHIDEARP